MTRVHEKSLARLTLTLTLSANSNLVLIPETKCHHLCPDDDFVLMQGTLSHRAELVENFFEKMRPTSHASAPK